MLLLYYKSNYDANVQDLCSENLMKDMGTLPPDVDGLSSCSEDGGGGEELARNEEPLFAA